MFTLKQSTSVKILVGPFVDATDGVTPETGITLGAADQAEIVKHDAGAVVDISGATWAALTGADGWYNLTLTASHTDTVGMLTIIVQDSSVCLPVFVRATVVPAVPYDSLVGGTDTLQTDPIALDGDATAMDMLVAGCDSMETGAAIAGTLSTTQMTTDLTETTDDHYNGCTIKWTSGVLEGQCTDITDYTGSSKLLTYTAVTEAPGVGDTFVIL